MRKLELSEEERKAHRKEVLRLWSQKNRKKLNQQAHALRLKNLEHIQEYQRKYYQEHKEKWHAHRVAYEEQRKEKYRTDSDYRNKRLAHHRQRTYRLRMEVLKHYGGASPKCACCGEANWQFLAIDHVYGNGVKHRKTVHVRSGTGFFYWLKRNNFPEGFQVLCFNCNFAKSNSGKRFCPVHHPEEYT